MKLAIEYSFRLRFQDEIHQVIVPAERLLNVPLDIEAVRQVVEGDDTLLSELFRDFAHEYRQMARDPGYWSQELERTNETFKRPRRL